MDRLAKFVKSVPAVLAVLALVGLFLPERASMKRSTFVEASPGRVFEQVNRFRGADQWFPWLQGGGAVRTVLEGPAAGAGRTLVWSSDHPGLGSGNLSIVDSSPYRLVRTRLALGTDPPIRFDIEIAPARGGAQVTFNVEKEFGFRLHQRYMGLLLAETAGPQFDAGLLRLKAMIESMTP